MSVEITTGKNKFEGRPGPEFRTKDHPMANGRTPKGGEIGYVLYFPLEDGTTLKVYCGQEGMRNLRDVVLAEAADRN